MYQCYSVRYSKYEKISRRVKDNGKLFQDVVSTKRLFRETVSRK